MIAGLQIARLSSRGGGVRRLHRLALRRRLADPARRGGRADRSGAGRAALVLEPQFVLLLVLPPVIYISAINMSWREFQFNLRPILLLAVGCVVFTTISVSVATNWLLGWPWAVGFVLGAIVSPPDALAPLAIARRMQLPRRISVILEGEGLANDATALVLYRFAVAAVSVGSFSLAQAGETFTVDHRPARSCGALASAGRCCGCVASCAIRALKSRCR